jgi:hypothetical protein
MIKKLWFFPKLLFPSAILHLSIFTAESQIEGVAVALIDIILTSSPTQPHPHATDSFVRVKRENLLYYIFIK